MMQLVVDLHLPADPDDVMPWVAAHCRKVLFVGTSSYTYQYEKLFADDPDRYTTSDRKPWLERKENYLAHLEHAGESVLLVSAADKLHNVRAIIRDYDAHRDSIWERFKGGRDGTLWYYETVAHTLARRYHSPLTRDLQRAVDELLRLAAR